jgi:hypothetical protein
VPKTGREQGPSKADGTQPEIIEQRSGDLYLTGRRSDFVVQGDLEIGGMISPLSVVTMPAGLRWGIRLRAALASASTSLARLTFVSDSIGLGQFSSNWLLYGWVNLVRRVLQNLYGDGGSGYIGHANADTGFGGSQVTTTGAWTAVDNEGGINRQQYKPTTPGNQATITLPFRGTTLRIFYRAAPAGFGTWDYKIDNGSFVSYSMTAADAITYKEVTGIAAGDHTVTIRATTGDGRFLGISAFNATGVVVDNMSFPSTFVTQLSTATTGPAPTDTAEDTMAWHTIKTATAPTHCVVLSLGAADVLLDLDDSTFEPATWDSMGVFYNACTNAGPSAAAPPDLIIVAEHVGQADTLAGFSQYERDWINEHALLRQAATVLGAPFVDVWADGERSWGVWNALNYWATGPDTVHPNNAGHRRYAQLVLEVILWRVKTPNEIAALIAAVS